MPLETAVQQWRRGAQRLDDAPVEQRRALEHVTDALVEELRRRLGGGFSTEELVDLYEQDTSWCLALAMRIAPEEPWAWDAAVVTDAAFARYGREAADYAGGRRGES